LIHDYYPKKDHHMKNKNNPKATTYQMHKQLK
jgi:hypothetical protein